MVKNLNFNIALYIRVSTEEQAENPEGSIKNQEQRLREAVSYRNRHSSFGSIVGVYVDAGISAKDMNRPQLQEMLKSIRRGEINLVMVTELSRLSRNNRDFLGMWDLMHEHQCRFMSLREDFDTTTAAGEMLLFQLMNFAQFERKQTSERVEANIAARAQRGLYNGGCVPIGYKLIPEKSGYLAIDEESATTVQSAFDAFLREGCLSEAAKWLNDNGFSMSRHMQGGGSRKRVGQFTVDNLHKIIKNKMYIGVKIYSHKGEKKEAKAVWDAIIDETTFRRANEKLVKNRSRMKPTSFYKLPYLLSGLAFCMKCGAHMPGKSATGKKMKVAYYEHSWATKLNSTLSKPVHRCDPHRVLGKRLEPLVWQELVKFLTDKKFIETMLSEVKKTFEGDSKRHDSKRLKAKLYGINSQIEAMAERLSQLPKTVSAIPIYKQMERLEMAKQELESAITKSKTGSSATEDSLVKISTFEAFAHNYKQYLTSEADHATRKQIVQKFIKRIEIGTESIKIHWLLDREHYERESALRSRSLSISVSEKNSRNLSSFSLYFGTRDRT